MTDLTPIAETAKIQLRPPTFSSQSRHCGVGVGCKHFVAGTCTHAQAEWSGGHFNSRDMRLRSPQNRWPKREVSDWCGWWRPNVDAGDVA